MLRHKASRQKKVWEQTMKAGTEVAFATTHESAQILKAFGTSESGLAEKEVKRRLRQYGHNEVATEKKKSWFFVLLRNVKDPLTALLLILGIVSAFAGDMKATALIGVMLVMSVVMRFVQEMRANSAAEKLKAMVRILASVFRHGKRVDVPLRDIVPGDIVYLSAGAMIPADLRLLTSRNLSMNQSSLTGESMPVEKYAEALSKTPQNDLDASNICFMGTNVESGTATAVVIATGVHTKFGTLALDVSTQTEAPSGFDRGVQSYTWLMIRFIAIMVPAVFLINGFVKHDWVEAFLFAVAVAVGLTPEMLPMIVTVNLSKGAIDMSRKKVVVKKLNAIQDFGAMDVLCTDKTGTLTEGKVALVKYVDIDGRVSDKLLDFAVLSSHYQTGLKNLLDDAVMTYDHKNRTSLIKKFPKIDEIPFDFNRRRMSVVVKSSDGDRLLICKGAPEEILAHCTTVVHGIVTKRLDHSYHALKDGLEEQMSRDGFRVIALAVRSLPNGNHDYAIADESHMTLVGFLAFLDPPKSSAAQAIAELAQYGVGVKILTGDNELVTRKVCDEVKFSIDEMLLGSEIENMSDVELLDAVEKTNVFSKLEPSHKERVIRAIQKHGHIVGFLGDGINDAPALKAADVGISVNSAVDIAKESSDIILGEQSLTVLKDGVIEGRRAFGNIAKYIKMTASSNYGNMFSIVGASIFLPFLPMLPLQIIINNLLYDFSQASIPTDGLDDEYLKKPRQWNVSRLRRFILWIGPVSSLFDYATFILMIVVFDAWANPALFHTGWFVESLFTQTLVIHILRTKKIPFLQSRASIALTATTFLVCALAAWLPYSPIAGTLGFTPLPVAFWLYLLFFIAAYFVLAQTMKQWLIQRYGWD